MIEVINLKSDHEQMYKDFLKNCPSAMFYHSLKYKKLLKKFLTKETEDNYLIAIKNNKIVASIPLFIINGPYGYILNSLPFYGSHGGILAFKDNFSECSKLLFEALWDFCDKKKVSIATIINPLFHNNDEFYINKSLRRLSDSRIGQVTCLPEFKSNENQINDALFQIYHYKTRNMVRKGLSNNFVISHSGENYFFETLFDLHTKNLNRIGGVPKPKSFFDIVSNDMIYDEDYRIYFAKNEKNEIICSLMLLYFKNMVEYFIPAIDENWRSSQPLSALIHKAMHDAVIEKKSKIWNWGGTWHDQDGVYRFKSRWGAQDIMYKYHTFILDNNINLKDLKRNKLIDSYPWFYTVPYSSLM